MMMASRFRVNFRYAASEAHQPRQRAGKPRAHSRRADLFSSRLAAFPEPVIERLGDALRGATSMIAMRSRDTCRLLTNALPSGAVISWFRSSLIPGRQMIRERALHALRLEGRWKIVESTQEAHSVSLLEPILALI